MKELQGVKWIALFILQLIFSPLSQILVYKYIATTQNWIQPYVGFFRILLLLYLIPFIIAIIIVVHTTLKHYQDINKSPFKISLGGTAILTLLSIVTLISDYTALFTYHSLYQSYEYSLYTLELRLPFYLCLKLILTTLLSHLFSALILGRFFVWDSVKYFLIQLLGLIIYEFTIFDSTTTSEDYSYYLELYGDLKFIIPALYTYNDVVTNTKPFIFQWLPHFLIVISSICNSLIPILNKVFLIREAYKVKLQFYQKQKEKIKDTQLNVMYLDNDMSLKPRLVTKVSQIHKRFVYLYEKKHKEKTQTNKFYKIYKKGKLYPSFYKKILITEKVIDPVTNAFVSYKKDKLLNTQEEERLERIQVQREKELGIVKEDLHGLPQNGYSLQSRLKAIAKKEYNYLKFRRRLTKMKKKLKKVNQLDEMTNDFNYIMFHQHLYCDKNEYELAKEDLWFNSPGLDLIFQDYSQILGSTVKDTFKLNCLCQFLLLFPLLLIIENIVFDNREYWASYYYEQGYYALKEYCSLKIVAGLLVFSSIIIGRPFIQHYGITKFTINQLLNLHIVLFYLFYLGSQIIGQNTIQVQTMQLLGYTLVIFGYKHLIMAVEDDMKRRTAAQTICLLKSNFESMKRIEAQKIENQLCYIYDQFGEAIFRQAVQDSLFSKSAKALAYLSPSCLPLRKLFDEKYRKTQVYFLNHKFLFSKIDWGGGYPRPQLEMISAKWQAGSKQNKNPPPNSYISLPPNLNIGDFVHEKQDQNSVRKVEVMDKMKELDQKRKNIALNQKLLHNAATKINRQQQLEDFQNQKQMELLEMKKKKEQEMARMQYEKQRLIQMQKQQRMQEIKEYQMKKMHEQKLMMQQKQREQIENQIKAMEQQTQQKMQMIQNQGNPMLRPRVPNGMGPRGGMRPPGPAINQQRPGMPGLQPGMMPRGMRPGMRPRLQGMMNGPQMGIAQAPQGQNNGFMGKIQKMVSGITHNPQGIPKNEIDKAKEKQKEMDKLNKILSKVENKHSNQKSNEQGYSIEESRNPNKPYVYTKQQNQDQIDTNNDEPQNNNQVQLNEINYIPQEEALMLGRRKNRLNIENELNESATSPLIKVEQNEVNYQNSPTKSQGQKNVNFKLNADIADVHSSLFTRDKLEANLNQYQSIEPNIHINRSNSKDTVNDDGTWVKIKARTGTNTNKNQQKDLDFAFRFQDDEVATVKYDNTPNSKDNNTPIQNTIKK